MSKRQGITRARFEKVALDRGFTVVERHLNIYYSSLGRSCPETFLAVMDGDTHVVEFNEALLQPWIPESYVLQTFDDYAAKVKKT
jgi:hypothetical protein